MMSSKCEGGGSIKTCHPRVPIPVSTQRGLLPLAGWATWSFDKWAERSECYFSGGSLPFIFRRCTTAHSHEKKSYSLLPTMRLCSSSFRHSIVVAAAPPPWLGFESRVVLSSLCLRLNDLFLWYKHGSFSHTIVTDVEDYFYKFIFYKICYLLIKLIFAINY